MSYSISLMSHRIRHLAFLICLYLGLSLTLGRTCFSCCFCFGWISSAMRNRTAYSRLNVYHNRRKEKSKLTNRPILSDANAGRFNTANAVGLVLTASPFIDCPIASEYVGVTLCSSLHCEIVVRPFSLRSLPSVFACADCPHGGYSLHIAKL